MKRERTVNLNGTFYSAGKLISTRNRAFLYGDSVFESIRYYNRVLLWDLHFARLLQSAASMGFVFSPWWTEDFFRYEIIKTVKENKISNARVRLLLFREEESAGYLPPSDRCSYLIEVSEEVDKPYEYQGEGLNIGLYKEVRKCDSPFSFFKSGQSLLYVMASRKARNEGLDEMILFNDRDRLCESSSGNLWLVKENTVLTPAAEESCITGVMRKHLLALIPQFGMEVKETALKPEELDMADELWISNAAKGLRWASRCEFREYKNTKALELMRFIQNETKEND